MTTRHQVRDTDTVEYLANQYLGTPDRWREIVDYNNLVYPYLSKNPDDRYKVYADGFIKITRSSAVASNPLTLRKYWTVYTRKNIMSAAIKTYYLTNDVTLDAGQTEAYAFIRSVTPGVQGNTSAGTVTELGGDFTENGVTVTITNENPVNGGTEGFVRTTGEYVFIPSDDDAYLLDTYDAKFSYDKVRFFYGDDLKLDSNSDLIVDSTGDIATVSFIDNVIQGVNRLFTSEVGDMLGNYSFGNRITDLIGDNNLPFEAKKRLIVIEILECLNQEDRVSDPVINSVTLAPSELACYVDLTLKVVKLGTDITIDNLKIGGR